MSKNRGGQNGQHSDRSPGRLSAGSRDKEQNKDREYNKQQEDQDGSKAHQQERAKLSIETVEQTGQNDGKEVNGNVADPESGKNEALIEGNLIGQEGGEIYNEEDDDHEADNAIDDDDHEEGDAEREQRMRKKQPGDE